MGPVPPQQYIYGAPTGYAGLSRTSFQYDPIKKVENGLQWKRNLEVKVCLARDEKQSLILRHSDLACRSGRDDFHHGYQNLVTKQGFRTEGAVVQRDPSVGQPSLDSSQPAT